MDKTQVGKLIQQFLRIMNKYNAGEKKPLVYGQGNLLYRSEVHTIEAIGDLKSVNVTDLATYLGVTKGAISQMIDKLVNKRLVNKTFISPSVNEVALTLTEAGILVYKMHQDRHREMDKKIMNLLTNSSVEQLSFLANFQDQMENLLDEKNK